jgi:hypothetical protein
MVYIVATLATLAWIAASGRRLDGRQHARASISNNPTQR